MKLKKLLALSTATVMAFSMVGCGSKDADTDSSRDMPARSAGAKAHHSRTQRQQGAAQTFRHACQPRDRQNETERSK